MIIIFFISTVKCNVAVGFSFFFVKDQILVASFELKQVVAVLKCSMCVFTTYFVA